MRVWRTLALGVGLTMSVPALADTITQQEVQLASAPTTSAATLAGVFGRSVDTARTAGTTPADVESRVAAALEAAIIESGAAPMVVGEALGMTLQSQQCQLVDRETGAWSRAGCAAIADLLATVTTALGGPAAGGPTGGIAGTAGGAPPASAAGSDYAED